MTTAFVINEKMTSEDLNFAMLEKLQHVLSQVSAMKDESGEYGFLGMSADLQNFYIEALVSRVTELIEMNDYSLAFLRADRKAAGFDPSIAEINDIECGVAGCG